jgi:hypothetical protein
MLGLRRIGPAYTILDASYHMLYSEKGSIIYIIGASKKSHTLLYYVSSNFKTRLPRATLTIASYLPYFFAQICKNIVYLCIKKEEVYVTRRLANG